MPPFARRRAEAAIEAARLERARMLAAFGAHIFESIARVLREMARRDVPTDPSELRSAGSTS